MAALFTRGFNQTKMYLKGLIMQLKQVKLWLYYHFRYTLIRDFHVDTQFSWFAYR